MSKELHRNEKLLFLADVCHREKWLDLEGEFLQQIQKHFEDEHRYANQGKSTSVIGYPDQFYVNSLRLCKVLYENKRVSEAEELAKTSANRCNYYKSSFYESTFLKFLSDVYRDKASDVRYKHDQEEQEKNKALQEKLKKAKEIKEKTQ